MQKIAIMGAMLEEIEPLLKFFGNYESIKYGGNTYYKSVYNATEIIIAYSKIGKVNATITATTLIEKFGATKLLFSGVAGAVSDDLKIGDLVIASKLAQHDLDITAFGHPFGYVPEGAVFVDADTALIAVARDVALEKNIALKDGIIVTGDQFVNSNERKEWIKKTFDASALEMEGAAVAVTCDAFGIPFFVLRAISDAADMDAGFNFDVFLESSAKISADFIISMVGKIIENK